MATGSPKLRAHALPAARWHVQLMGELRARSGDVDLGIHSLPGRPATLLFARLLLEPATDHARDDLALWLWPQVGARKGRRAEDPAAIRRSRLRRVLSQLCRQLQLPGLPPRSVVIGRHATLRLNADAFETDVQRFEDAVRRRDPAQAGLPGELLPGFDDPWVLEQRARLAALRRRLAEPAAPDEAAEDDTGTRGPGALLAYTTRFFGRQGEIEALRQRLASSRLVVVTGPGGCGKTRLAAQAARELAGFEARAFVPLAGCSEPAQIFDRVRAALQVRPGEAGALEQVVARLAGQRALLLLDNFEQLVGPAGEEALGLLLQRLPLAHALVSSRRALQRADASTLALAPLPLAAPGSDVGEAERSPAVALFVDRAKAARTDFRLHARNVAGIAAACQALDGLPLAIELAASRVREFSPREIGDALRRGLATLARQGAQAGAAGRHRSLEAALDWSWRLLGPAEQIGLTDLAVLRGSWTQAQAQAVLGGAGHAGLLAALQRDSLLQPQGAPGEVPRLAMLNSVREFAAEHTEPARARQVAARHRRHFLALALERQASGRPLDEADLPNCLAAIANALHEGDSAAALALALALAPHWTARGTTPEAQALLLQLLRAAPAGSAEHARLRCLLPRLLIEAGRAQEAQALAAEALAAAGGDAAARAEALYVHTQVHWLAQRDHASAQAAAEEALRLAHAGAAHGVAARALLLLGAVKLTSGQDVAQAAHDFVQARALFSRIGDPLGPVLVLPGLTACLIWQKRYQEAVDMIRGVEPQAIAMGSVAIQLQLLNRLGESLAELGDHEGAVAVYRRHTRLARAHGMAYHLAFGAWNQCLPLARLRRCEEAARLMAFSKRYWEQQFGPLDDGDRGYVERVRRRVVAQLGAARWRSLRERGQRMSEAEGFALACA